MFEGIFQPTHLVLILAIVLIIFGPGKLPQLGRTLGDGIREFRGAVGQAGGLMSGTEPVLATAPTTVLPVTPVVEQAEILNGHSEQPIQV